MSEIKLSQEFVFYNSEDGTIKTQVIIDKDNETIWATQKEIAHLFEVGIPAISKHIKNIYEEGELEESTTISKMETVVQRGFRGQNSIFRYNYCKELYELRGVERTDYIGKPLSG